MNRHPQADQLSLQLRNAACTACPLHSTAQEICLLGDGPVPCETMIVGEAPGFREENVQIPFSGKSGLFLRKQLKEIGLDPRQIYITNVVHCHPPGNRTPKTSEAKTCAPLYLDKELEAVKPRVILCLGNVAVAWAKGHNRDKVTKIEGSTFKLKFNSFLPNPIICVPSRHPSAVIRAEGTDQYPFIVKQFKENLLLFKRTLNPPADDGFKFYSANDFYGRTGVCHCGDPVESHNFGSGHSPVEMIDDRFLDDKRPVYLDIETNGLNPFKPDAKIWSLAISKDKKIVFCDKVEEFYVKDLLQKVSIIPHRATFEGMWLKTHYGIAPRIYHDTKLCAHLMNENEPTGLKYQCIRYLGVDPWDEEQDFQNPDFDKLLPYNARDVQYGLRLYKDIQLPFLRRNPKIARLLRYILLPATEVFIEIICNGVHIDAPAARKKLKKCQEEKARINEQINEIAGKEVNPGSPKQMNWLFYKKLGMTCPVKTKKGADSTAEASLIRLKGQHRIVDLELEWRKWQKYEGTYLVPWLARGPILHFNYDNTGTDTGRFSSTVVKDKRNEKKLGATLHQCPRDPFIRNLIVPRNEDWCIAAADLSQAELRLVAHAANEPTMIGIFNRGEDIHYSVARTMQPTGEIIKETRKKAKAISFGFIYGMWAEKFLIYAKEKFEIDVTLLEAEDYRKNYFSKFSMLQPWHRRVESFVRHSGYVESVFGRRRHLPEAKFDSGADKWIQREAVRNAINSPIQSAASDLMQFIAALIASYSLKWDFKIDRNKSISIGSAHDSLLFECEKSYAPTLKKGIEWTVKNLPTEKFFGFNFRVPIVMDINIYRREWEGDLL